MFAIIVIENLLRLVSGRMKPLVVAKKPPGAYGTYVMILLGSVALFFSVQNQ